MKNLKLYGFVVIFLVTSIFLSVQGQYVPRKGDHLRNYKGILVNYLNQNGFVVQNTLEASYMEISQKDNLGRAHGTVRVFFMDSTLYARAEYFHGKLEGTFTRYYPNQNKHSEGNYTDGLQQGLWQYWYENEQLKEERMYDPAFQENSDEGHPYFLIKNAWTDRGEQIVKNGNGSYSGTSEPYISYPDIIIFAQGLLEHGLRTGLWTGTNENGEKLYEELYDKGQFIEGSSYDQLDKTYEYNKIVEYTTPEEGMEEFYRVLGKNIKYPKSARRKGIQGRVFIKFTVDKVGNLQDIEVLKGISAECDQAAVEALKLMPPWIPGKIRGQVVKMPMYIPVFFKLD